MSATLLIVDDDAGFNQLVVDILQSEGYTILQAACAEEALEIFKNNDVDLVLTDQRMPGLSGLELTRHIINSVRPAKVIVMTAHGTIPQAVEAVQAGAADYLTKPLESPAALRQLVVRVLGSLNSDDGPDSGFVTHDRQTLAVLNLADRAAATDATVLIIGESGTGKELLARRVHEVSRRASGPFVAVNCAAIPDTLAESEFFGHEKGAFTGADRRHAGRFEQAGGGTLFLDEVGELPEAMQAKLLRVLEERVVERVGGLASIDIDIRLIAATNRNLESEVATGRFRNDLFYRLNVVSLEIPPLRHRQGDLDHLVPTLTTQIASRLAIGDRNLDEAAMAHLNRHHWPGNVRELRNVLERAMIAAPGTMITSGDLPEFASSPPPDEPVQTTVPIALKDRERQAILDALARCDGHREQAADMLGISVRTLYNRLKKFGIG